MLANAGFRSIWSSHLLHWKHKY